MRQPCGLTLARSLTRRHKVAIRLALVLHSRLEAALDRALESVIGNLRRLNRGK